MKLLKLKTVVPCLLALVIAQAAVTSLHADAILMAGYWAEATTDSTGTYNYNSPVATQAGNAVTGTIPTDATTPDRNVINYFRTLTALPGALSAYNGVLLGNLSAYNGLTATFSLYDTALAPGALFTASDLIGEMDSNFGIRLIFMGDYLSDGTPNEWWSNPAVVYATSLRNGEDVTLTVAFDPSQWSNYYGHRGTESVDTETQFTEALADITRLGLSFGSGYFFSDGFAFNTGGSAQIELDAIGPTSGSSAPEPGTFLVLGGALCTLGLLGRRAGRHRG